MTNATESALSVTRMSDPALLSRYAMSVTLVASRAGARSAGVKVSQMRITARSALRWRKTEMAVRKLSI